jgi:hypothetical protein
MVEVMVEVREEAKGVTDSGKRAHLNEAGMTKETNGQECN